MGWHSTRDITPGVVVAVGHFVQVAIWEVSRAFWADHAHLGTVGTFETRWLPILTNIAFI